MANQAPATRGVVLVAEDDPAFREFLSAALARDGLSVVTMPDGEQAIDYLDGAFSQPHQYPPPDVVITDLDMDNGSGFDVIAHAAQTWRLPAIMLTAFGDDRTFARARALGATRCLSKPVSLTELRRALAQVLTDGEPQIAS